MTSAQPYGTPGDSTADAIGQAPERTHIDRHIEALAFDAVAGAKIAPDQLEPLFALDEDGAEAALILWAAQAIGRATSNNTGQVYAQIGLDALPCPMDCQFCSLSRMAAGDTSYGDAIVPLDEVVRLASSFDRAGVHLISLMATAALPYKRILEAVRAVREAVSADMPIMINMGDMSLAQAIALKEAGAQVAYHALRLGEGTLTRIRPETRLATIEHIRKAGLALMTAVEPIHAGYTPAELLESMQLAASLHPYCSGVDPLTPVAGTPLAQQETITRKRAALYAAIFRLMVGTDIPFGTGSGNVVWVDAGTNPRGRSLPSEDDHLARYVALQKKALISQNWHVPERPLPEWF